MNQKCSMYQCEAKSMPNGQFGYIVFQKVDGKSEISLCEGEEPFTVKEAKEIINILKSV